MVAQFGQVTFISSSSGLLARSRARTFFSVCTVPAIDHEDRAGQRLRVALHFGGKLAHLSRMGKPAMPVGHDADRQRHQGNPMQLAPAIFPEEIARPAILVVVLQGHQRVEHLENLTAYGTDVLCRNDEDEVVPPDVPHEASRPQETLYHVVEDPGENVDDAIALVVTVAIIEFLEVIQVRVADGEFLVGLQPPADLPLDLGRARQPGRRVDRNVPLSAHQHRIQPRPLLRRSKDPGDHLVHARGEPGLDPFGMMRGGQGGHWNDGGEGVALEPAHQTEAGISRVVSIHEKEARMAPQNDRLHLIRLAEDQEGEGVHRGPLAYQGRNRTTVRRKEEYRRASPHLHPLVRSYAWLT